MKTIWHGESKCQGVDMSGFYVSGSKHGMESTYKGVNRPGQDDISVSQLVSEPTCHSLNLSRSQCAIGSPQSHVTELYHVRESTCQRANMQPLMQHVSKLTWDRQSTCHFQVKTAAFSVSSRPFFGTKQSSKEVTWTVNETGMGKTLFWATSIGTSHRQFNLKPLHRFSFYFREKKAGTEHYYGLLHI